MIKKHLLIILLLFPLSAAAVEEVTVEETKDTLEDTKSNTNGYSFDVFLTYSTDFFDVVENSTDNIGGFVSDQETSISLSLNSPYKYFGDSKIGYYFNYNFRRFEFNRQDNGLNGSSIKRVDLGTSTDGYNLYAYASAFYSFGDKFINKKEDSSVKLGVGLGLGYLKADGNIILTERANMPLQDVDISGFGPVLGIFLDYRKGPWILRVEAIGTEVNDGPLDFQFLTIPIQIGYTVNF